MTPLPQVHRRMLRLAAKKKTRGKARFVVFQVSGRAKESHAPVSVAERGLGLARRYAAGSWAIGCWGWLRHSSSHSCRGAPCLSTGQRSKASAATRAPLPHQAPPRGGSPSKAMRGGRSFVPRVECAGTARSLRRCTGSRCCSGSCSGSGVCRTRRRSRRRSG